MEWLSGPLSVLAYMLGKVLITYINRRRSPRSDRPLPDSEQPSSSEPPPLDAFDGFPPLEPPPLPPLPSLLEQLDTPRKGTRVKPPSSKGRP